MTSIPSNLTLIREDFRKPRSLRDIKADMLAAPTDYVMVVGDFDGVDVFGSLTGDVHYLATHVGTVREFRYSRPVLPHDPLLLTQFNYLGSPILHQSLVSLFPETAVEPWHAFMVRAQTQGASFSLVSGAHMVIETYPRPKLSGAYAHFKTSFDPAAVMEAIPTVLVESINHRPFFSMKSPRAESVTAFCHNCSSEFIANLAALNVQVEILPAPDYNRIKAASSEYVAWFDGMAESLNDKFLGQLQTALEFPGVSVACPKIVTEFTPASYHMAAFWLKGGIYREFSPVAWMSRTRDLSPTAPSDGCTNSHAILRQDV